MGHEIVPNVNFGEYVGHEWDVKKYAISYRVKKEDMKGHENFTYL